MISIYTKLENCYGIPKMEYNFQFSDVKKAHLIYAPNGIMKTSFANTIEDVFEGRETKDVFFPERQSIRILKFNSLQGDDLGKEDILVIKPYAEYYKSENQNVLVADQDLRDEYEALHNEIKKKMDSLFKHVNSLSRKRSSENLIAADFAYTLNNIYDLIEIIYDQNIDGFEYDYSNICYGEIISSDAINFLQDQKVKEQLIAYITQYELLLTTSPVFKINFNHNNAEKVLKNLSDDGYFSADHKIILSNTDMAIGEEEFKKKIENEKRRILDEELAGEFARLDKLLSSKKGLQRLRDFICANKALIPELLDIENFKKKIWISYILKDKNLVIEAVTNYKNNKRRLKEIVKTAKEQLYKWHDVTSEFNERFSNMPFSIHISNQDDIVLKDEAPLFDFMYKDREKEIRVEENLLIARLSNGEKKALYLLNVIFEIEAKKSLDRHSLIVMDDIADSFDYRNKYAIIEYIKEIVEEPLFLPIILTHNFDFYRTLAGRVGIKPTSNFVIKTNEEISLHHGQYFDNVFDRWRNQVYENDWIFLSAITFVRNLVEYVKGRDDNVYCNLTNLLHYKIKRTPTILATDQITVSHLIDWYSSVWGRERSRFSQNPDKPIKEFIYELADKILEQDMSKIEIEYKILLSIASRLKAETYMIARINNNDLVNQISKDQTRRLKDLLEFQDNDSDKKVKKLIEKVLIITSENIHINSFMYEPIVDMSLDELKNLYAQVTELL